MIAENTAQEIWNEGSNDHYHAATDASDRLANDQQNGTGIVYDYAFATDVVRTTVGMIAEEAAIVPEPGTLAMLAMGLFGLLAWRRRIA